MKKVHYKFWNIATTADPVSKVYRERKNRYPSGWRLEYLVYDKSLGKCVWCKADNCIDAE